MAPAPLYDMTVPVYIRSLEGLLDVLKKGEEWAKENNVDSAKLAETRLYPDMLPLKFQIQSASNTSKAIIPRIAQVTDVPSLDDNETNLSELVARIQKTIDILKTAKPEDFVGKEEIPVELFGGKYKFTGVEYIQQFGLSNFFFHVTMAYAILRKEGVAVGKLDYLGANHQR